MTALAILCIVFVVFGLAAGTAIASLTDRVERLEKKINDLHR